MNRPLLQISLRLAGCAFAAWLGWRWLGAVGLVAVAPLVGVAFARPLLDALAGSWRGTRNQTLRDLEGRHYAFHGVSVDIVEDADGYRWLRLTDVRKLIPGLPADAVLAKLHADGVMLATPRAAARIKAEALHHYLKKATDQGTLGFKRWLQREVVRPADKRRERA